MANLGDSQATVHAISRASYIFVGPGSPANRKYNLLDFEGLDSKNPIVGVPWSVITNIYLGTPVLSSATFYVNAQAVAGATSAVTQANTTADVERTNQYVSSNAGDTTQHVTVTGTDQYKTPMTERITLNGTTIVQGKKAFLTITAVAVDAAMAGNLSVGTSTGLGLPIAVDAGGYDTSVKVTAGVQTADAGTITFADRTIPPTNATGDTMGTYVTAQALNGSVGFYVRVYPAMGANGKTDSSFGVGQA